VGEDAEAPALLTELARACGAHDLGARALAVEAELEPGAFMFAPVLVALGAAIEARFLT